MQKILSRTLLAAYLLVLAWLVLFKLSFDFISVVSDFQSRSLNLLPFAGGFSREMIDNFVVFIPFGLLLGINLKRTDLWRKLAYISIFSVSAEVIQFVLAIGRTDITDVIMNTLGGLIGLVLYDLAKKHIDSKKLDLFIIVTGALLLVLLVVLRTFFLRVKY